MRPTSSLWLAALAALGLAGCNTTSVTVRAEPSSFKVHIVCAGTNAADCPDPQGAFYCPKASAAPDLGNPQQPVPRTQIFYLAQVTAIDSNGAFYAGFDREAYVYVQFEGSVTPRRDVSKQPLAKLKLHNGAACLSLSLPAAFNQSAIWVEEPPVFGRDPENASHRIVSGSFAAGASETIYRPAPLVADVQYTTDPTTQGSALDMKHVIIDSGASGAPIVVTFVAATYFTVTDLGTPGRDHAWGSLEIYTYSRPENVRVGSVIQNLSGSVSNYLGLPELNHPMYEIAYVDKDPLIVEVPAPHRIYFKDLGGILTAMAPYKSAIVEVASRNGDSWWICPLSGKGLQSYYKYNQWIIAPPTADCTSDRESMVVMSNATIPAFDPLAFAGKKLCSLRGIMALVKPASMINLWTITPRDADDLGELVDVSVDCL